MFPLHEHSPGSKESIAPNRFSKFNRERTLSILFRFSSPCDYTWTKIEIKSKKRVPGRILKNGLAQSIPETLENVNTEGT